MLRNPAAGLLVERHGKASLTAAVREVLDRGRREILAGQALELTESSVVAEAEELLSGRGLRRVVNATGVILHTNLGRSVLSERAVEAVSQAARSYSNLEYDLSSGRRGSRYDHAVPLLKALTGAEDALVVNNCAAATLLALSAAISKAPQEAGAPRPEVIVSRGQLIEIGGGFRIPEVLELSGAKLREVGTTNRTRCHDYESAIDANSRAILWVHPSNFEVQGFTESVGIQELSGLGLPLIADVGSGAMLPVGDEPLVRNAVRDGAELVIFSGDKLLGGPQAGILVGSARWISEMRRHPLARAMRADKLCLAALEATLTAYLEGSAQEEIPTVKMIQALPADMRERAEKLASGLRRVKPDLDVDVSPSVARSGGGTLPVYEIPSFAVRVAGTDADLFAEKLRATSIPVVGRVYENRLWLDVRTLLPGDDEAILEAFANV